MNPIPDLVLRFLEEHGAASAVEGGRIRDLPAWVRAFTENCPAGGCADPDVRAFVPVVTAALCAMDDQLYEHYRPLVDLYRRLVLACPEDLLGGDPVWREAAETGGRKHWIEPALLPHPPRLLRAEGRL